jgi:hypothetical protein
MRFYIWTASVVVVVLAVLTFVFVQIVASQDAALESSRSAPPSNSSSAAALTPEEELDRQITTNVNLYGQLVCDKLAEQPEADINALVARFIETYGLGATTPEQQQPTAERLLTESAVKFCPDQIARIDAAFANK